MVTIRMAKKEDISGILAVERESFEEYLRYSPAEMRYLLFEANSEGWVAEMDGKIAGYYILLFRKNARVARLYSIAVAEEWRGKGIGRALLQHAEKRAIERGCSAMHLEVKTTNCSAIDLYTKNGYSQVEILPDYYKKGVHGIRMEKRL
ncbi:MAG: GNAT family N-acetyltransferase [Thermoplasmata archaeon]|nr:GNAT family N-acetyltransferase [Thermoplasmata archaeon]